MDTRKGKSHLDDDEVKKIDLTLKLGPSLHYNQNQEENEDDATCRRVNDMGNWNVEYNSSSAAAGASTNYLVYHHHQGSFPHNAATIPTRKRPNLDDTKACKACGSNSTPLWRKGPDGPQTLCNACGLRHLRTVKKGGDQ